MGTFRITWSDFLVFLICLIWLIVKLSTLSIRFGDGNVYVYASQLLLSGFLPYRDFFVVVPPTLLYFIALFGVIFGQHLILYSLIPYFCELLSAIFIYLILRRQKLPLSFIAPALYLFSFTILSTTDYLSGVAVVNFFVSASLSLFVLRRYTASGIIIGFALTTKFYTLPIILGLGLYLFISKQFRPLFRFCLGFILMSSLIMFPYLLFAPTPTWHDLVAHQLSRTAGLAKSEVLSFFIGKEIILLLLALSSLFIRQVRLVYLLPLVLLTLFFLIFSDIYYLYLASLMPFIVLLASASVVWLWSYTSLRQIIVIFALVAGCFIIYQTSDYLSNTAMLGRFSNSSEIAGYLRTLPIKPYYGNHDIAPVMALLNQNQLFANIIDTNPQTFTSGANNMSQLSQAAVNNGVYLLARTINHPEYANSPIGYEEYFDPNIFITSCRKLRDFDSIQTEIYNQITIYDCQAK